MDKEFHLYNDIRERTGGEIYIGVVGPVRTGKSTFINSYAKKACTKTGNKPGVTKGKQWIKLSKEIELLDTPGILWPKFSNEQVGIRLALVGSINDQIINMTELSYELIKFMSGTYAGRLTDRYGVDESKEPHEVLRDIAVARACMKKGGEPDEEKAIKLLFDDFRSGKLGRVSLERPEQQNN